MKKEFKTKNIYNVDKMYDPDKSGSGTDIINAIRLINSFGGLEGFTDIGYADSFFEYWFLPPTISSKRLTERVAKPILERKGDVKNILVIGCGSGGECIELVKLFKPDLVALDIVPSNIIDTNELVKRYGFEDHIRTVRGNAHHLPFEDGTFSSVFCCEVAFHFENKKKFLQECLRVLKKNGVFTMADIVKSENVESDKKRRMILKRYGAMLNAPNFYTKNDYLITLKKLGLREINIENITSNNLKYMAMGTPYMDLMMGVVFKLSKLKDVIAKQLTKHDICLEGFLENIQTTYEAYDNSVSEYISIEGIK